MSAIINNDESSEGGDNNAILHSNLMRGTLQIKATEIDIRRSDDETVMHKLSGISSPIETDYILEVQSTNKVKFDNESKSRLSTQSQQVQELEKYHISKRYVDMRHLASAMRSHAEDIVRYYEVSKVLEELPSSKGSKTSSVTSGGGHHHKRTSSVSTVLSSLEKVLHKPVEVAQYITNSEPKTSNLTSDLDSVFHSNDKKSKGGDSLRRTSAVLHQSSPTFVRQIMVGVDEYYESIFSEKRQFSKKTNYDLIQSVAERRKTIINNAFTELIHALQSADLASIAKRSADSIPQPLELLIKCLEKFLLTDVVMEEEQGMKEVDHDSIEDSLVVVSRGTIGDTAKSSLTSSVEPVTTRRRASYANRAAEEKKCKAVSGLILLDENEATSNEDASKKIPMITGLLPDDPIDIGIVAIFGVILFKLFEGRAMNIQLDVLLAFGLGCGILGYRLALPATYIQKKAKEERSHSHSKHVTIVSPDSSPHKASPNRRKAQTSRRELLRKSTGTLDVTSSLKEKRLSLIQASMRSVKNFVGLDDDLKSDNYDKAAYSKTFPKFPEGAKIGSHLNCWSEGESSNFHVRGPNYLADKKKVPSAEYLFPTRGCDLFLTDNPPVNIGRNRSILEGKLRDVPTFIINYRLPWGVFLSYNEIPERFLPFLRRGNGHGDLTSPLPSLADMPAGDRALCNFLLADTEEKNHVLKMVPVVVEGPWVVKRVVGGKPAIVGNKLPITYTYQPPENGLCEYLEADLDIVSSAAARNILAVVRSYTQVLTIDLGFVVQGNKEDELPEQMMMGLRLHGLDPLTAELLPEFDDGSSMEEHHWDDDGNETE